ncbi:MAG: hypothetical protein ACQEUN_04255 [Pseudomonadota bacterium]
MQDRLPQRHLTAFLMLGGRGMSTAEAMTWSDTFQFDNHGKPGVATDAPMRQVQWFF